jgi:orotidine-5'-phosphate decarboxylase
MKAPVVLALDTTEQALACQWVDVTKEYISVMKLGLEFYLAHGGAGVRLVRASAPELKLFLDLKLHDIPHTVTGAVRSVAPLEPDFLTVHASGGAAMIEAAAKALPNGAITAVTLLTSLSETEISGLGISGNSQEIVTRWALHAVEAGALAIVASPHEVAALRSALPAHITLITPGVRPAGSTLGDQARVATPQEAIGWGADYVVIGRPITSGASLSDIAENARVISCSL